MVEGGLEVGGTKKTRPATVSATVPDVTFADSVQVKEWCAQGDDSRTFLSDFVAALQQIEFPAELNL